jgi:hypothetical protein
VSRLGAWLVTLPLALAGVEAAHAFANSAFGSPEGPGELFASAASGARLAPLFGAMGIGLVAAGVCARVLGTGAAEGRRRLAALPFACVPPVVFVALEVVESLAHGSGVPFSDLSGPTFLAGLLLQLPFALVAYAVAVALLRVGSAVRRWFAARRARSQERPRGVAARPAGERACALSIPRDCRGRAPPRLVAVG